MLLNAFLGQQNQTEKKTNWQPALEMIIVIITMLKQFIDINHQ